MSSNQLGHMSIDGGPRFPQVGCYFVSAYRFETLGLALTQIVENCLLDVPLCHVYSIIIKSILCNRIIIESKCQ
ncbi:hypothetical protein SBBP1_990018 [Burkholderiales bacterium]|nr:hypothetical protein SBBP1_990018 [Burkholderiales bacterium]